MAVAPVDLSRISERYFAFANDEAKGISSIYQGLALAVAGSRHVLAFLATLPADRRQLNLFLAAVRHLFGVPRSADRLIDIIPGSSRETCCGTWWQ